MNRPSAGGTWDGGTLARGESSAEGRRPGVGMIAFMVLFFLLALWLSGQVALTGAPGLAIFAVATIVVLLSIIEPEFAVYGLIFGMLLSPEIEVPRTWINLPSRKLVIRIDDLMIILASFAWMARQAAMKGGKQLFQTPLNPYLWAFSGVAFFSTTLGIFRGSVPHALTGYLFVIKFTEFFLLYFLLVNVATDEEQLRGFLFATFVTVLIICAWVAYTSIITGTYGRATAPFEEEEEPATLGGYLLFSFAIAAGLFTYARDLLARFGYALVMVATVPALLYTQSRATYLAFFPALFVLFAVSERKGVALALLLACFAGLFFLPEVAVNRIRYTFQNRVETVTLPFEGVVTVDPSSAARLIKYQEVFQQWLYSPLWGQGVTGVGFVDSQIVRVFGELGVIGVYLLYKIFRITLGEVLRLYRVAPTPLLKGLALGYLAGTAGLLVHGLTSNTFVVVRIAGPFWFMTGLVLYHAERILRALEVEAAAESASRSRFAPAPSLGRA